MPAYRATEARLFLRQPGGLKPYRIGESVDYRGQPPLGLAPIDSAAKRAYARILTDEVVDGPNAGRAAWVLGADPGVLAAGDHAVRDWLRQWRAEHEGRTR